MDGLDALWVSDRIRQVRRYLRRGKGYKAAAIDLLKVIEDQLAQEAEAERLAHERHVKRVKALMKYASLKR